MNKPFTFVEIFLFKLWAGLIYLILLALYPLEYLENSTKWSEYKDIYLK